MSRIPKRGRAQYRGLHPHIAKKFGNVSYNSTDRVWLFQPDDAIGIRTDWYRVQQKNLKFIEIEKPDNLPENLPENLSENPPESEPVIENPQEDPQEDPLTRE